MRPARRPKLLAAALALSATLALGPLPPAHAAPTPVGTQPGRAVQAAAKPPAGRHSSAPCNVSVPVIGDVLSSITSAGCSAVGAIGGAAGSIAGGLAQTVAGGVCDLARANAAVEHKHSNAALLDVLAPVPEHRQRLLRHAAAHNGLRGDAAPQTIRHAAVGDFLDEAMEAIAASGDARRSAS